MRCRIVTSLGVLGIAVAATAALVAWHGLGGGEQPVADDAPQALAVAPVALGLRDEAIRLYAAGQFPKACERFSRAAERRPASAAGRQDVARCFEAWGWQALRGGRAGEATTLFQRALVEVPGDAALLRGLGLAAVHEGRSGEALDPLERALSAESDPEVHLILARLYDRRDRADRALAHLTAVLEHDPGHYAARTLLEKIERERHVEAGFRRDTTRHFVVKYRGARDGEAPRAVLAALEVAWERVGPRLDYRPAEPVLVVIYDDEDFRQVTRVHGWVTGVFDGKIRLPLGATLPAPRQLERLVAHEYAHAVIHDLARGRAPRWLHEGLAQALEGATADPMLRVPGGLTLTGLEALVADPDPVRARDGYDIALWVVEDLLHRGGLPAARRLLERLGDGAPLPAALAQVYGIRLAELESQWRTLLGG